MNSFFTARPSVPKKEGGGKTTAGHVPWVEKYRPKTVDDLVFQNEVVSVLKKVVDGADLPNLLFYGPPGTGKTSAAVAVCRQMFKTTDVFKDRVLEMNASDERGIQIVRTKIKEFAQRAVPPMSGRCAALKIVILDEADAMTHPAQAAMRRTMEKYSKTTRFFLICNYISRIIDPLTSRCAKFRFKALPVEQQMERMKFICNGENVDVDDDSLGMLIELCEGDLRKSITYLQSLAYSKGHLDKDMIRQMTGRIEDDVITALLDKCRSLDADALMAAIDHLRREGHSTRQLIVQFYDPLLTRPELTDFQKAIIFEKMAVCESRLLDGADEYLQLLDLTFCIQEQFKQCN